MPLPSAPELPNHIAEQYGLAHSAPIAAPSQHPDKPNHRVSAWYKLWRFMTWWWRTKWFRWTIILAILGAIGTVGSLPNARYKALNAAGVHSSASVLVVDDETQLPLPKVAVRIGDETVKTDRAGIAHFHNLLLGKNRLHIERRAFADYDRSITIGWGSNPLGTVGLNATGVHYELRITDAISTQPIVGAEVDTDSATALSDSSGKVSMALEDVNATTISATISASGYHTQTLDINVTQSAPVDIVLSPIGQAVFISKQSGKYDLYASDLDGRNAKIILAGTGLETSDNTLVVRKDGLAAALVSTRDDKRDSAGYLLRTLTLIDLTNGKAVAIEHAEQIQLIDWIGGSLVYNIGAGDTAATDSQRNRLVAYNYEKNARIQLATANQFTTIMSAQGSIYFAASSADPTAQLGLFRIQVDGSQQRQITDKEVWSSLRTAYSTMSIQTPDGWYGYNLADQSIEKLSDTPSTINYMFSDNTAGKASIWPDIRDGKGVVVLRDEKGENHIIQAQDGLTGPLRWVNDKYIIYRIATGAETADYIVSQDGGNAHKIADVSPTYGYANAY